MDEMKQAPAPAPADTEPATGTHGEHCPDRNDGEGNATPCTHWDHDQEFWQAD